MKNAIIKAIYNLYINKYIIDIVDLKPALKNLFDDIKSINNVTSVSITNGVKRLDKDLDNDPYNYIDYKLVVKACNQQICGTVRCLHTDNDHYNIILNINDLINETLNFNDLSNELLKAKNLNDLKRIAIKYIKEGVTILTISTMFLVNFNIAIGSFKDIFSDMVNNTEITINTPEAEWKLLANDVLATVYNAVPSLCNKDILHTASMFELDLTHVADHKIIAMERTMMKLYGLHYGTLVRIEGTKGYDGIYQIQDTMNKRFKGKHKIDILVGNDVKLGKWDNVKIYKLANGEECALALKQDMLQARNQMKIDARQSYIYGANTLTEGLDFDEDPMKDILKKNLGSLHKVKYAERIIDDIKNIILDSFCDERYNKNTFFIDDSLSNQMSLVFRFRLDGTTIKSNNKYNTEYYQYIIQIDKETLNAELYTATNYDQSFWYTINKCIMNFIINYDLGKITTIGLIKANNSLEIEPTIITLSISFFHSTWQGESYYLPKTLKIGELVSPNLMISDELADKFPDKFINKAYNNRVEVNIYVSCFNNIDSFAKVIKPFVDAGYCIITEYSSKLIDTHIINKLNFDDEIEFLRINQNKNIDLHKEKQTNIEKYLTNLLGQDTLDAFRLAVKNTKQTGLRHFYIGNLSKARKLKNIYKKLSIEVVRQLLIDNGIDINAVLENSYNKWNKCLDNGVLDEALDYLIDPLRDEYEVEELYGNSSYNVNYKDLCSRFDTANRRVEANEAFVLRRFMYKMVQITEELNPNGWNNKDSLHIGMITNNRFKETMYGSRPFEFQDMSLAIDNINDLYFMFYAAAWAITNGYDIADGKLRLHTTESLRKLIEPQKEPNMQTVNLDALVKCFKTVIGDLTGQKLI